MDVILAPGACTLLQPYGATRSCWLCGTSLVGRQRRWCSPRCRDWFWDNHDWGSARSRRLQTDRYICAVCGCKTVPEREWMYRGELPHPPQWDDEEWKENPAAYRQLIKQKYREYEDEVKSFRTRRILPTLPEVNHIVPRAGGGYGFGCWNHQDNLETLCHRDHVRKTVEQAVNRKMTFAARVYEEEMNDRRRGDQETGRGTGAASTS